MARNIIPFELRKGKDDDIAKALEKLITNDITRSDIIRAALRHYLNQASSNHISQPVINPPVVVLQAVEKGDDELDAALENLFNF